MANVSEILTKKGNHIYSISPGTTVYHALEIMVEKNVSALLVTENEELLGIFTERDYARKIVLKGKSSKETIIGEIMTTELITVSPGTDIDECMQIMTTKYIRHLPVKEEGKLKGIISIGDAVRHKIEDQKFVIDNMQQYISG